MKSIIIKDIKVKNFKGFTELKSQNFDNQIIIIQKNGTGKTSLLDSITYVLTNKLLNGQTTGWEVLDKDNQLTNLLPFIEMSVLIDNSSHTIKLENGKRYIDGISFTSFKGFQTSLENLFGFPMAKLHQLISPKYFLEYVDTKVARTLFLESYSQEIIENEIKKINQIEFDDNFWNKIKVTNDINTLLTSIRSEKNQLLTKIKIIEENKLELKEIKPEELTLKDQLDNVNQNINQLVQLINQKESLLKVNCSFCGQLLPGKSELDKEEIQDQIKQLNSNLDEFKEQKNKLLPLVEEYNSKVYFNDNIKKLQEQKDHELLSWKTRIEELTKDEINIQNYQDLRIQALKNLIKESNLPFDLKLFHKNKTSNGYVETFTLLSNGVDYKFLNNSQKLLIGIELSKFFQKQLNVKIQILVDDLECLDDNKIKLLNNIHYIGMKVG